MKDSQNIFSKTRSLKVFFILLISVVYTGEINAAPINGVGNIPPASYANALFKLHDSLRSRLNNSPFKVPLIIESQQSADEIKGDVYAEVKYPFTTVSAALASPQVWCDILILHLNTKSCRLRVSAGKTTEAPILSVSVGKKLEQPLASAFPIEFTWGAMQRTNDFLQVNLSAASGPLSTRNYRILLEAIPLENGTTFIHLSYSYGFGATGKFLMKAYLSTIARNKVGFTITGKQANGQPTYVEGLLGLVERNTMRYHLAVDAYLGSLQVPGGMQFEKRIGDWYAAAERYPQQLHEIERGQYLDMKRVEYKRQHLPL